MLWIPIFIFKLVCISFTGVFLFLKSNPVLPSEWVNPESLGGTQLLWTSVLYF